MSEVKVNKISPRSGTTVTLGDSGDTFTIPSGATINNQGTAVNFGATGSASWVTTVKTGDFTAVAGEGYVVNTTSGAITVTLPASPSAGAVVAIKDYANTFDTNAVTLGRNGSNIGGNALDSTVSTEGLAATLVFVDATKGWLVTDSGLQSEVPGPEFIVATGGTITTSGNFKIHTFTGPGALCVSSAGNCAGSNTVSYVTVAGGGGGGYNRSGGGGGGGYRESKASTDSYTASPLNATSGPTYNLPVSVQSYPVTVGGGGAASPSTSNPGSSGVASSFSTITSAGGGGGGDGNTDGQPITGGLAGGSGGGGGACSGPTTPRVGGAGNTPNVSPPQGNNGGTVGPTVSVTCSGAGGGGAGAVGANGTNNTGGAGGVGVQTQANPAVGSPSGFFGGGGGGGGKPCGGPSAPGGFGGGAGGSYGQNAIAAGTVNTGGGGGGTGPTSEPIRSTAGGSGIVIIRYKFQ